MMRRVLCIVFLFGAMLSAQAHVTANGIDVDVRIDDEGVRFEIYLSPLLALRDPLIGAPRAINDPSMVDDAGEAALIARLRSYFASYRLRIDGIAIDPLIEQCTIVSPVTMLGGMRDYRRSTAHIMLRYPLTAPARRIAMVWELFPPPDLELPPGIDPELARTVTVMLRYGEHLEYAAFAPQEPESVWHRPDSLTRYHPSTAARIQARTQWLVPIGSVLACILMLWVWWRAPHWGVSRHDRSGIIIALVLLAGALSLGPALRWQGGEPPPAVPEVERARTLFERLHRNIYIAFAYDEESAIYDALARSVDGAQLDEIYRQVYRSLILREEQGVVCDVTAIDYEDIAVERNEAAHLFSVTAQWVVTGSVRHYAHRHERVNRYRARYTIAVRDGEWRIVDSQPLNQERLKTLDEYPESE